MCTRHVGGHQLGSVNRLAVLCSNNGAPVHPFQWKKICCCQASAQARSAPTTSTSRAGTRAHKLWFVPCGSCRPYKKQVCQNTGFWVFKGQPCLCSACLRTTKKQVRRIEQTIYHRSNLNLLSLPLNRHFPKKIKVCLRWQGKERSLWSELHSWDPCKSGRELASERCPLIFTWTT